MGTSKLYPNGPLVDAKYMIRVRRAAEFIRENWTGAKDWSMESLMNWVGWCWHAGCIELAITRSGQIEGVGIARPVVTPTVEDRYQIDLHSENVHVDLLISKTKGARRFLWRTLAQRFGWKDTVSFHHHRRGERLVIHQFNRYNDLMEAI